MRSRIPLLLAITFVGWAIGVPTASAQKDDMLYLVNGDTIRGQALRLQFGRLRWDSDMAGGKVSIKWKNIVTIQSDKTFEIQLANGRKLFGSFASTPQDSLLKIELSNTDSVAALGRDDVVFIKPVKKGFWPRWEGSLSAGLTALQANSQVDYNITFKPTYRGPSYDINVVFDSFLRSQQDTTATTRNTVSVSYVRLRPGNWVGMGLGGVQENSDLGLQFRGTAGGAYGKMLAVTSSWDFGLAGGLNYNGENYVGADPSSSLEGLGLVDFNIFLFGKLDTEVDVTYLVYPSLTQWGRVRMSLDARLKREVAKDFFLELSFLDDFDSDPPTPTLPTNDFTLTFSVGWTFE